MSQLIDIKVPDIGDFKDVPVIEILVKPGDQVELEAPLVTLESDKATLDVPASAAGIVRSISVQLGDRVSEGSVIVQLEASDALNAIEMQAEAAALPPRPASAPPPTMPVAPTPAPAPLAPSPAAPSTLTHATPSVRAYARELGVDLARVKASGPKGRILREDVSAHVKAAMTSCNPAACSVGGLDLLPWPQIDFSKFGETETRPLSRIQKISAQNLARNWVMIPAVTYHEDADITDLEAFRQQVNGEQSGVKLTLLAFLIKAVVKALQQYPQFNAALKSGDDGEMQLVLKKYFHIGFAADTPNGLVVPVIKNADQKSVREIAAESGELARQARDGKLKPADMQGACFTISSLGGIGGTGFAPIVNAPEVAILGVSKAAMKPVWNGQAFVPRLITPLSLTADHRVIDGALATRFNAGIAQLLADFRRVTL